MYIKFKCIQNIFYSRLEKDNIELRRQKDTFNDENNTLHSQIERRDGELERLRSELSSLNLQLQAAVAGKCQAFAEVEEIRSKEISLDYKYVLIMN